ncbi:MAG: hypothetical protein EXR93_09675 [Gemmatimonadetes bacterium]|nr:hypothetical protein [Gemmatimonadota bacterium]
MKYSSFKIFSIAFGAFYTAFFISLWSPFRYYPMLNKFSLAPIEGPEAGPPILWYGWVAAALVSSAVLALIVPRRLADRLWHGYTWLLPAITLVVILVSQRHWFL